MKHLISRRPPAGPGPEPEPITRRTQPADAPVPASNRQLSNGDEDERRDKAPVMESML